MAPVLDGRSTGPARDDGVHVTTAAAASMKRSRNGDPLHLDVVQWQVEDKKEKKEKKQTGHGCELARASTITGTPKKNVTNPPSHKTGRKT